MTALNQYNTDSWDNDDWSRKRTYHQLRDDGLIRPPRDHAPEPPYRTPAAPAPKPGVKLCAVPGCFSPAEGGILCAEHYSEHVWEGVDDD